VQTELRRVGCLTGEADGNWNTTSQRSLTLFNRYANTKFDTKLASTDALDTIKSKTARVCPVVCDHGFKAQGDSCVKIVCAEGTFLNDDNECQKRSEKKPIATREKPEPRERAEPRRANTNQTPALGQSQALGQGAYGRQAPYGQQSAGRPNGPGLGQRGQVLTGQERQTGCNSYSAIMSGVCP